jgi:multidrug efflux pump subunit AcrA (membrane-fusion protein)
VAGRLWKLRQRFGIAAPKVSVRTHMPWYLRWLGVAVLLAFSAALAAWMYDAGRRFAGFDRSEVEEELTAARGAAASAHDELARLRAATNAADSKISIERTAQQQLAQQMRSLEQENARLREELAIFESMLSSENASPAPLSILRFKVEPDVIPGEYRYRVLLLAAGPRRGKDFQGRLELVVSLTESGRDAMIVVPGLGDPGSPAFRLNFKHFQRAEGIFRVNPKAKVKTVQVRVYEGGGADAKATQIATLQ